MHDARLTEERLRTFLDANQVQRERLCCALLPLLGHYEDVKPRRPKGGPDGGRDIQARIAGGVEVWGAVGFRNQVSDSPDDKTWAKKKFKDDIVAARDSNRTLTAFVFFTNIDLAPAEVRDLKTYAEAMGINSVDVFYREELRRVLDSVPGAPYRLKYLGISMSQEEQVAFFDSFGRDLHHVLQRQHQSLDDKIMAVDFRIASMRLVKDFRIALELDKEYFPSEIGHFRIHGSLTSPTGPEGLHGVSIGGREIRHSGVDHATGRKLDLCAVRSLVWPTRSLNKCRGTDTGFRQERLRLVTVHTSLVSVSTIDQLADLQDYHFSLHATQSLCSKLARVAVVADGWVLVDQPRNSVTFGKERDIPWPEPLESSESRERLRDISFATEGRFRACHGALHIDFEKSTPLRVAKREQDVSR